MSPADAEDTMQATGHELWSDVLDRLRELQDEVQRAEEFIARRMEEGARVEARGARGEEAARGGGRGARENPDPEALDPRPSGPVPSPELAPHLLAEIRADLASDPIRALDFAYPPGLFAPGAPPEWSQRECLRRHSHHTARLAMFVAERHGYQPSTVEVIGLCALLHDVGLETVPPDLFSKSVPLMPRERALLEAHAIEGAERLAASSGLEGLMRAIVPRVVRQHHERSDGSGYPDGLDEPHIHEFARLLAIVEAYETMISPRPYRQACLPHEAMEALLVDAFGKAGRPARLDKRMATSFLRALSLYPIGSGVELASGEKGQVVGSNPDAPDRPHVRLLWAADGQRLERPRVVDLRRAGIEVARAVPLP